MRATERRPGGEWLRYAGLWLALVAALLVVYAPALTGTPLWDDDAHLLPSALRGLAGLSRIWFEIGATQQYYPVVYTLFWTGHRLWGDAYVGFHLLNVLLHATSALLIVAIVRRIALPGAILGAALFALHPVQVESVAWMSELKNTLSTVFYLGAALVYLRFDEERRPGQYGLAFVLFMLALLSKSVTATLPAALLVVIWFKRGGIAWKRDAFPLVPWLVVGIAAGLVTANLERTIGAEGDPFALSAVQRLVLAGRVVWFYAGKLVWPAELMFVYPRWDMNALAWWDYLYTVAAVAVVIVAWSWRVRSRGPLAALLLFGGTLVPVLGFFDVYPFLYSYVADHFQYLASIAFLVSAAATLTWLADRFGPTGRVITILIVMGLAAMSREQSRNYRDAERLYRATIATNAGAWLAHNNLVPILRATNRRDEALLHAREAVRLGPSDPASQSTLAVLLNESGDLDAALDHAREAVRLRPRSPNVHTNLGALLAGASDFTGAKAAYAAAIAADPRFAPAHADLGRVFLLEGDLGAADTHLATALTLDPDNAQAHYTRAQLLRVRGDEAAALEHYARALMMRPRWSGPLKDLQQIASASADAPSRDRAAAILRQQGR